MTSRSWFLAVFAVGLLMPSCGTSSDATHDSPSAAVVGLINTLRNQDVHGAANWVAPSQRDEYADVLEVFNNLGLTLRFQVSGDFAVRATSVDPSDSNRATVQATGSVKVCSKGTSTTGEYVDRCAPFALSAVDPQQFPCLREGGNWYVDVHTLSQIAVTDRKSLVSLPPANFPSPP